MPGEAILWLLVGGGAGAGGVWWWYRGRREMGRSLREAAERWSLGQWRARAEVLPSAGADLRVAGELLNLAAEQNLRRIKDLSRQAGDRQALVDALPDPILLADTRRKIILVNAPASRLLDLPPERVLGQGLEQAVPDPSLLAIFDRVAKIELGETNPDGTAKLPLRRELRLTRGGRKLAYQAVATRTEAGGVLLVLRDISTLDQTLRMKADFVANASHELRTPVAAIKAAHETLAEVVGEELPRFDEPQRQAAERCLGIVGGHVGRLEEMLADLLDLSRVEGQETTQEAERLTAGEIGRELRQTLGALAADRKTSLNLPEGKQAELSFVCDRRLLMLALKNLVENAIRYTPDGGEVRLEVERHELSEQARRMHKHLTGESFHEIHFIVRDTGVGIAPEHRDRIFERFYQLDSARTGSNPRTSGRGTGLGLSIVKHAVGGLGGLVRVESEVGRGSVFTVVLPQTEDREARQTQKEPGPKPA